MSKKKRAPDDPNAVPTPKRTRARSDLAAVGAELDRLMKRRAKEAKRLEGLADLEARIAETKARLLSLADGVLPAGRVFGAPAEVAP